VRNQLDWAPVVLFVVIFVWTPPHFWALAIRYRDDYAAADVPMLPSVADLRTTAVRILRYTLLLWVLTLLFGPLADMGPIYLVSALVLGGVFTVMAVQLLRAAPERRGADWSGIGSPGAPGPERLAMRLFSFSITYVTLLFAAMAVDSVVRGMG
jgi:protoheme IX farnesyltransferase